MALSIVPYSYFDSHGDELYEMEDRIICGSLTHYASSLLEKCFHNKIELEHALQKTLAALRAANQPISKHFRTVFVCGSELRSDWMISDLGLRLLLINADVTNPMVARLQVELLSDGFEPMKHD
jgi:hypothetical protein